MKATANRSDRQVRAYQEAGEYLILPASAEGSDWWVTKQDGTRYTADAAANTCTCPDHVNRKTVCKHIHLVRFHLEADAPAPFLPAAPVTVPAAENPFASAAPAAPRMSDERYAQAVRDRDLLWG